MSELTYSEVGATGDRTLPPGYSHLEVERRVGGPEALDRAGDVVLAFGLQRGSGVEVETSQPLARAGLDVLLRTRVGPLRMRAPTRVVYVVSEPDRRGFAYGTLPGHPEQGEELFLVERRGGSTHATVRAFSRPGRWFTRLGGPVVRRVQRRFVERYLDALERELQAPGPLTREGRGS